jgi:hypothetical protein
MKHFLVKVTSIAIAISGITFAARVDCSDSVLIAYKLTPAQSAEFNTKDNAVSAFWDLISETDHDCWNLLPSTHSYLQGAAAGFINDSDAQMIMKAAYDAAGAYFYFRVLDNQWMAGEGMSGWEWDIVDLYLDNRSSSDILADPAVFINGSLTNTCQQYWIPIGGDSTPVINGLNYWNSNRPAFINTILYMNTASQKIEVIRLDSNTRVLEMFVPWADFGMGGVTGPVQEGAQFAISGGYNDIDSTTLAANCLRILHNGDPYQTAQNYWADLELGPEISAALSGIKCTPRLRASRLAPGKINKSEYFTFAGRKIDKPIIGKYHALIRQDRLEDGTISHTIIRY